MAIVCARGGVLEMSSRKTRGGEGRLLDCFGGRLNSASCRRRAAQSMLRRLRCMARSSSKEYSRERLEGLG